MRLRRASGVLAITVFVAGCPAFVYDPPYVAEEADAGTVVDATTRDVRITNVEDAAASTDASMMVGDAEPTIDADPDASSPLPDGAALDAAADDGSPQVDGGCAGVICNGVCNPAAADCAACTGKTNLCLATKTCQPGCGGCGSGVTCLLCPGGGSASAAAVGCGDGCLTGQYPHCSCTNATSCGTAGQTCVNSLCTTCGELSTGGQHCYGTCTPPVRSETCTQSSGSCSCM